MSNIKDRVKQISQENDTFLTATALIDTEVFVNGYYYYTIKTKQTGSTVPMVRVDQPNFRLENPINAMQVSVKKLNDTYTIVTQGSVDTGIIFGSSRDFYGRGGNGAISPTFPGLDKLEEELVAREAYVQERLKEAQDRLNFELEKIYDPGGELRNEINTYIDGIKAELENGTLLIQGDLDAAEKKLAEVEAMVLDVQNPAGTLRQQILGDISAVKTQIEADNSVLDTRFKTAIQGEKQAREDALTVANQRLTDAETDINAINQHNLDIVNPGSPLRTEITNEIANVRAAIEAEGSVLDSRFDASIEGAKADINQIKTVDLPAITDPNTGLIKQAKNDLTNLMDGKDTALKTSIESKVNEDLSNATRTLNEAISAVGARAFKGLNGTFNEGYDNWTYAESGQLPTPVLNSANLEINTVSGLGNIGLVRGPTALFTRGTIPIDPTRKYRFSYKWRAISIDPNATDWSVIAYGIVASLDSQFNQIAPIPAGGTYTYPRYTHKIHTELNTWYEESAVVSGAVPQATSDMFRNGVAYSRIGILVNTNSVVEVQYIKLEDITDLNNIKTVVDSLDEQINSATNGLVGKVSKAVTDIQDLSTNKAAKSVVDQLSTTVGGNSSNITNIQGVLSSNGIDNGSNIAGRLTSLDTQVLSGPNSLSSKVTSLESTKASKQDLAVEANRIYELEVAAKYKDNLIKNPGLESDALYWHPENQQVERLHYTDSRVPTNAPTTYVLRTNARDTLNDSRMAVAPGDTFYFSVWTAAVAATTFDIRLMIVYFDRDGVVRNWDMAATHTAATKGTWRKLETAFTVPDSRDYAYIEVGFQQERSHDNTDYANSWYLALPELRQTNAIKEVKGRITNVETVVGNASSGLVQKVNQLDSSITAPGVGINAKITDLTSSKANVADLNASNLRINSLESTTTVLSKVSPVDSFFNNGLASWTDRSDGTDWGDKSGVSITTDGKFRIEGRSSPVWAYHRQMVAVDPTRTYRMRFKVRTVTDSTIGGNFIVYAGVATYDANGNLESSGAGSHRYFAASEQTLIAAQGWQVFEGTITGRGDNANQFRATTKYVRPMFILNYNGGNAVQEVEYITFEDITDIKTTNSRVTSLEETVSTGTNAHAKRLTSLETSITSGPDNLTSLRSGINSLSSSKADVSALNAQAGRIDVIDASLTTGSNSLSNLRAGITRLENVVVNGDSSHVNKISNLEATLHTPNTGVIARITSAEGAISNANSANATSFRRLEARLVSPANGMGVFNFADGFSSWVDGVYTAQNEDVTVLKIINTTEGKVATNLRPGGAQVGPKTRINIKPGMVVNAQFKYKRNTYNPAHQNNIYFGFYALDKNMQSINGWPVWYAYANHEWTNKEWVSVNVDCAMDTILEHYPRARYVLPFFLLNQSNDESMYGPAEAMSLSGLELKDVTVPLRNKWVFRKYEGFDDFTLSTLENLDPSQYYLIDDANNLVTNIGDSYRGRLTTQVYNKLGRQVTFTAIHDDGGRIYVNGAEVYYNSVYANANVSFYVPAGWSTIDMIWQEGGGADGWINISNKISNQVELMGIGIDRVSATITEISNVAVDAQGKANAIRGVELDVNGKISGYKSINNGITSEFVVNADKFKIYNAAGGDQPVFVVGAVNGQNKLGLRADMLIDGSITADKLVIGSGLNLLANSDFSHGFNGWRWNTGSTTLASGLGNVINAQIQSARQDYWNFGTTTFRIDVVNGTPDAAVWFDSPTAGVNGGKWYYFQGVWAAHRTTGRVELDFLNGSEGIISRTIVQLPEYGGGPTKADWFNWSSKLQAPAGSVFARIRTVCNGVNHPENAVMWLTQYMIEEVPEGATRPSGWKAGGSTVIDAGMIRTGYIGADRIEANSIHGNKITADTLHGNRILGGTIIAGHIAAGNITTEHMNANSINADRLIARSITADKIKAGEITTQHLAANAVTADNIAAGAITASKLAIGGGENLIPNSMFPNNQTNGWHFYTVLQNGTTTSPTAYGIVDQTHGEYTAYMEGGRGIYMCHNDSPATINRLEILSDRIPIAADRNYIFSAHLSAFRSSGQLIIVFYNADDGFLTEDGSVYAEDTHANTMGGKKIPRYSVAFRSPAGAAFARVIIRGWSRAEQNYPFIFASKPMLELAPAGATEPSPFTTGGSTLIDAGLIKTGTIEADRLDANTVRSKFIAAGKITANDIVSQTITANELAVNSITTDKLNAGAITAEKITTDAIRAHHIAAYQISAGKIDSNAIEARHIQTDAIEARMLKAGAITADKLAVGGNNLLSNTEFLNGMQAGWSVVNHTERPGTAGFYGAGSWATRYFQGGTGMYLNYPNVTTDNPMEGALGDLVSDLIPVLAEFKYILSANLSTHRCYGQVNIHWYNSSREYIGEHGDSIPTNYSDTTGGNPIQRVHITQIAPTNAAFAQARFRIHDATNDPHIFVSRPMFEQVAANTDLPSVYSAPGSTLIDAGLIRTGVIEADRLDANTVRAKLLSAPKIQAGDILVDGTVKARQIDTGNLKLSIFSPTTGKIMSTNIEPGQITTELIATNAVIADKIKAGSITVDKLAVGGSNICIDSVFGSNWTAGWIALGGDQVVEFKGISSTHAHGSYVAGDAGIYVQGKNSTASAVLGMSSPAISVLPNTRYCFSAVVSQHRCEAYVNAIYYNANGDYIGESGESRRGVGTWSRGQATPTHWSTFTTPGNIATVRLYVRNTGVTSNDPYIFLSQPMLELFPLPKDTPTPYSPGGSLYLNGGSLNGNTLSMNMISTQYLRAEMLSAKKIEAHELAIVEQKNGDTVIKGTLIDKDGIFSTGNIVSQAGFYVLKPGSSKTIAVNDPKADSRVAFGVGADGNGFFSGDVYARNFIGNNSILAGVSEAEDFKMRTKRATALDASQKTSALWDVVRSLTVNGSYSPTNGTASSGNAGYVPGGTVCSLNIDIPASDFRNVFLFGNISFSFKTSGGYDVTNFRFRAEDASGNILGWASVNTGRAVTQVCIIPVTFSYAPLTSVSSGYQTRSITIYVKYVDTNYSSPTGIEYNATLIPTPNLVGVQLIA